MGTRKFLKATRGAAAVEFVVAWFPLHLAFWCFTQVAHMYTAHLVFNHAALAAGRAAIVIKSKANPGTGNGTDSEIEQAFHKALGATTWNNTFSNTSVKSNYAGGDPFGPVTTTVSARYKCDVPVGKRVVCTGGFVKMKLVVKLPHQGACYNNAPGC